MTIRTEWLGPRPSDESAADEREDGNAAWRTARTFRSAVRLVVGDEPPAAQLLILRAPDHCPHPFEVACEYDPTDAAATAYAERCRTCAPTTWAAAGLSAPEVGPAHGRR